MLPEVCQSRPVECHLEGSASPIIGKARAKAIGMWKEPEVLPVPDRQRYCACTGRPKDSSVYAKPHSAD